MNDEARSQNSAASAKGRKVWLGLQPIRRRRGFVIHSSFGFPLALLLGLAQQLRNRAAGAQFLPVVPAQSPAKRRFPAGMTLAELSPVGLPVGSST